MNCSQLNLTQFYITLYLLSDTFCTDKFNVLSEVSEKLKFFTNFEKVICHQLFFCC